MNFHIEGDQFYYTNNQGLIYKLLPLEVKEWYGLQVKETLILRSDVWHLDDGINLDSQP